MFYLFRKTANTRLISFIIIDILSIILAIWISFLIRFDGMIPQKYDIFLPRIIILAIIFIIPIFYFQKLYSFSWSYVSTNEAITLFKALTISFLFFTVTIYFSYYFPAFLNFPRSIVFMSYILTFIFCGLSRFSKRIYFHIMGVGGMIKKDRTLIIGAGDAGEQILRNILSSKTSSYFPFGFLDDNPIKQNVEIHGVKVLGKILDISKIVVQHGIKKMIIALPSASNKSIRDAVKLGRDSGLSNIKIVPPLAEIIKGEVSLKNLRDIDIKDLLGRELINLDEKQIENFIKNQIILITGAAGSIGSELSRQVAKFNPSLLILLDQDETGIFNISGEVKDKSPDLKIRSLVADIKDLMKISDIFSCLKPDIVFHAAAYKHVPLMEQQPDEAVKNNVLGTENLVKISLENNVKRFIFISTDKAVNPVSVMGATKRLGEMICQAYNQKNITKFISVRFGNVLDSRGSVIPAFRKQIKMGGPVEVTDPNMRRYFMLISEACLLVMQAGAMGQGGEVFVLDMGKPIKILDLAREMLRLSGFEPDKDMAIVFTGARPGEKLFEEILTAEEGVVMTKNQKIFMAKLSNINLPDLQNNLEKLKKVVLTNDSKNIISNLKEIVPYYKNP